MIPILYSATETNFANNGIGRLAEATMCTVNEKRNDSYELTLKYPVTGQFYSDLVKSNIIAAIPADGKTIQPFRIYRITKPIKGIITVYAEHISYQLSNIPVMPFTADSLENALIGLKSHAAENCPFTFWTDKEVDSPYTLKTPSSLRSQLGGEKGSILDLYGGEYEWDKWIVNLWQHRGLDRGVTIRYGVNLTDLEQEENISGVYTGVLPYWFGQAENSEDEVFVYLTDSPIVYAPTASSYPYMRSIPLDLTAEFDEPPTQQELLARANQYITDNNIGIPKVSLKISFVPLWQTEEYRQYTDLQRVNLCDTVTVYFEKLGINATSKVVETEYNVLLDRYNSITLGESTSRLSDSFIEINNEKKEIITETSSAFSREIARATNILSGGLGGHVVFGRNADGEINEILIMDTDDKMTAVNVIRLNQNGIGFSQSGYNGPYNSAWLIDNTFDASEINVINLNADSITSGTIDASQVSVTNLDASSITSGTIDASHLEINDINAGGITTGRLQDRTGNNWWDLDTGEISITATAVDVGIGARNYVRHSNTLDFDNYYFFYNFNFNDEQALLNNETMEVSVSG